MKKAIWNRWFLGICGVVVTGMLVFFSFGHADTQRVRYVTWDGLEPDMWASVWIIKNHIAVDADMVIRLLGAPTNDGIAFGVTDAPYRRSNEGSVYASLLKDVPTGDVALQKLGKIIHDIEISPWANPTMQESEVEWISEA